MTHYKSNVKGWRKIGNNPRYYFKSLWEIQFATYLTYLVKTNQILKWEYEPYLFSFPKELYRASPFYYKPDFKQYNKDGSHEWYEVKGYMDKASKTKMKRFAKHYPLEKMTIIDKTWFNSARKQKLGKIIGWETLVL